MDFSQNLRGGKARIGSASFGGGVPLARLRDNGEPLAEIGRSYNVSHSTISRLAAVR